jgi:hypothetical protein
MKKRTNYNEIASTYNQRYIGNMYPGTLKALRRILSEEQHHKVLEGWLRYKPLAKSPENNSRDFILRD